MIDWFWDHDIAIASAVPNPIPDLATSRLTVMCKAPLVVGSSMAAPLESASAACDTYGAAESRVSNRCRHDALAPQGRLVL